MDKQTVTVIILGAVLLVLVVVAAKMLGLSLF